jgi:hypothetical protein
MSAATDAIGKAEAAFTDLIKSAGTPDERAAVIEFLARRLGRGIVMLCNNEPRLIGDMLEGATAFAFDEAATFSPLFDKIMIMAAENRKKRP